MIYFTSDLHFGHENVIKYNKRNFKEAEEMSRTLIENWNSVVGEHDDVYILGDFTLKGASLANEISKELKGNKFLVKGNHDRFADQATFDRAGFVWVKDYHELHYHERKFLLFHYPIQSWNGAFRGVIHLHGHQHNEASYNLANRETNILKFDVGVDANGMTPVSIEFILEFFRKNEENV